jgi:hypothetical protein
MNKPSKIKRKIVLWKWKIEKLFFRRKTIRIYLVMLRYPYAHSTTSGTSFPVESEAMYDSSMSFTEIKNNITAQDFPSRISKETVFKKSKNVTA